MYPSSKSNFLLILFTLYTIFCVGIFGFLSNHSLTSIIETTGKKNSAILFKEASFSEFKKTYNSRKPDFREFKRIKDKKQAFFNYLIPMINHLNLNVAIQRENLLRIKKEYEENTIGIDEDNTSSELTKTSPDDLLSKKSILYLNNLSKRYNINIEKNSTQEKIDKLVLRIDQIPPSMILAQAANESAWGTSRFATQANNFFGQWCFRKGCGIVPMQRGDDEYHEVAKFKSVYHSLESYLLNINTHRAYRSLRRHRATLRNEGDNITGLEMIKHLSRYSERGEGYVTELRKMIKSNKLEKYDIEMQLNHLENTEDKKA